MEDSVIVVLGYRVEVPRSEMAEQLALDGTEEDPNQSNTMIANEAVKYAREIVESGAYQVNPYLVITTGECD